MTAQQLKNSILQLAVQGKLVPQDPNDEPVGITPYTGDNPFVAPQNWVWSKLGDAFNMQAGKFVKACDIYEDNNLERFPCYGGNGLRGYVDTFNTEGSFPLIGRQGALCGNINMAKGRFYATEHAVVAKPNADIDANWSYYALISLNLNQYSTATAQPGLAVSKISNVPISIPPLAEQRRIVERIEQLLPHIADYDIAEQKLTALNAKFPDRLKKSILQSAVQGKLVPQDENDEPASVLLERIRAEKEQLIKDGKLKKEKPLPPIAEDEIPFDVPESWEWVRLGEAFQISMGQSPDGKSVNESTDGMEFHQGKVFFSNYIIEKSNQATTQPTKIAAANSVLLCVRAPVGKVNITDRELCIGRGLCAVKPLAGMGVDFAFRLLEMYETIFVKQATGTTFVAITGEVVKNQLVPLPPLAEQRRIVTKCEELMAMAEGLR